MPTEIEKSKQASSLTLSLKTLETSAIPCFSEILDKIIEDALGLVEV